MPRSRSHFGLEIEYNLNGVAPAFWREINRNIWYDTRSIEKISGDSRFE